MTKLLQVWHQLILNEISCYYTGVQKKWHLCKKKTLVAKKMTPVSKKMSPSKKVTHII